MAGIGSGIAPGAQQMQPGQPAPQPGQAPQATQDGADDSTNVTPEEQAMYDQFMENAFQIVMPEGDQPAQAVMDQLQGNFPPELQEMLAKVDPALNPQSVTDNVAATTALIVLYLQSSAQEAGQNVPGYIAFEAGHDIAASLADVVGIDEQASEMAFYRACDIYRQISPFVDQDELAQEFGQLVEAEKSGALDQAVPGLRQKLGDPNNG